jgi:hypothetical protein
MNMEKSIDDIMNEMNDRAKAEGRYLGMAFWEIPRAQGSILDVPSTPEAEQRVAALRARRLERRKKKTEELDSVPQSTESGGANGVREVHQADQQVTKP